MVEKHHHEVAAAQHELGMKFATPGADGRPHADLQICASTTSPTPMARRRPSCRSRSSATTARACTATSRSGRSGKPLFAGNKYADLSEICLYYIGGVIKHAKALQRLHQSRRPTPTSGWCRATRRRCCSPIRRATARPRAASPTRPTPRRSASKCASPIPTANPYLAFTAMLMAGLDGIQNKIHPGDPMDKNLYDLPPAELKEIPTVCGSLREALDHARQGSRIPQEGRRLHRRPDRRLHRAQDGRGHRASR